ncbi:hypothetical protein [Niabella ginsengisoli]|uniref:Uncharacterized protein n=1 Tax=Niabella ginsengisoli TaxID=522298 RepID=A0ABS9SFX5_9BACT|nr:hypothetical protein [Niabella ginsengisoli]MCH5597263.1 hypothetical protein [Niabella ginsengisoli]
MKRNFLLMVALSMSVATVSFAQVSTTPETPTNYKPKAKDLAPMPGELTDEMIFPVLGKYEYTDTEGSVAQVTITRDAENKGMVWVNGMPQGKFKADLRISPSTYKIPVQKTLQNDVDSGVVVAETEETTVASSTTAKSDSRYSGKSLKEGTLVFDSTSNKLYINVGSKFDEENPVAIFPEMAVSDSAAYVTTETVEESSEVATVKKLIKKIKRKRIWRKEQIMFLRKLSKWLLRRRRSAIARHNILIIKRLSNRQPFCFDTSLWFIKFRWHII